MTALSAQDALITIMLVTSLADEKTSDLELTEIEASLAVLPAFRGYEMAKLPDVVETVRAVLAEEDGLESLISHVHESLPKHLRETAYALACDVAAADGRLALGEMRLLEELRHGMELDRLNAAAIERGARARHTRL